MTRLSPSFNKATIARGDEFSIELLGGGFAGTSWKNIDVTKGEAVLLGENTQSLGTAFILARRYRADVAGAVEIVATDNRGRSHAFQIDVI